MLKKLMDLFARKVNFHATAVAVSLAHATKLH